MADSLKIGKSAATTAKASGIVAAADSPAAAGSSLALIPPAPPAVVEEPQATSAVKLDSEQIAALNRVLDQTRDEADKLNDKIKKLSGVSNFVQEKDMPPWFYLPLHKEVTVELSAADIADTLKFNCSMDMLHGMLVAK